MDDLSGMLDPALAAGALGGAAPDPAPGPEALQEGFGALVRNLATGDVEERIKELRAEVHDVHTPEQQKAVLIKVIDLLRRLIVLRHGRAPMERFVHSIGSFIEKHIERKGDAVKELDLRIGEAIGDLARLRDELLQKRWGATEAKDNKVVEDLARSAREALQRVDALSDSDFRS